MKTVLSIKQIIVYSEAKDKYFHTAFKEKLNVIYGKNTAGKSTLIQLILYCFGINDNKITLAEILAEEIFVRIDCTIRRDSVPEDISFLRQDETLLVRDNNGKITRFNGIGSDNSAEHIKLKLFFNKLFDFTLLLESKSGVNEAPIEAIFLPYYVSQDVGWVYLRKSFSNMEFYKNFKEDYLDYYLGIENTTDRAKKREIENQIRLLQQQISFYTNVKKDNNDFEISKLTDDSLSGKANELIDTLTQSKDELLKLENKYVAESNKLTFYTQRLSVVSKVKRNHAKQFPGVDNCPTCNQELPQNIEQIYLHYQQENDTLKERTEIKEKVKKVQSTVNSLNKNIQSLQQVISSNYSTYTKYSENDISLNTWIDNKATIALNDNLVSQLGELQIDLNSKKEELKNYKTEEDILEERQRKNKLFKQVYLQNNASLGLPKLEEERFYKIYDISSLPFQGVQLHLAILSYHFAFNRLLTETNDIHRLPFILDSIFKEDIEGGNKDKILNFINSNYPTDTQTILSIADDKNIDSRIEYFSTEIFRDNAHLICIGGGEKERALLMDNDNAQIELIDDCFEMLETV